MMTPSQSPGAARRPRRLTGLPSRIAVLILDDERFDRHRMARLCSGLDQTCEITNATSLADFRATLDTTAYDLILIDYRLPDGSGLDALEAVRLSPRNVNAAMIMITGQGQEEVAEAALTCGCADYLTKDELTPQAFQRAVCNALEKSALSARIEAQSFARAEVERVLEQVASHFARDIKPMVSRMMRQLRDLREGDAADRYAAVDDTCLAVWESLVALERATGTEMMDFTAPTPLAQCAETVKVMPRKPPSPFSRRRH